MGANKLLRTTNQPLILIQVGRSLSWERCMKVIWILKGFQLLNQIEKKETSHITEHPVLWDYVKDFIFDEELLLVSEDGANLKDRNYPIAFQFLAKLGEQSCTCF
jgi:hypothetical protein